jgi:hypothetical protein
MFKLVRLVLKVALGGIVLLLIAAYLTNPSKEDFKKEVAQKLKSKFSTELKNPSLSKIAEEVNKFADQAADNLIVRKNYYICSIFEVELPDGQYNYLGAFHFFYPLQDANPLDNLLDK